jgi:hypothetical protein
VAVHSALGDEQPRSDLLVAEAAGDQARDIGLPLSERAGAAGIHIAMVAPIAG